MMIPSGLQRFDGRDSGANAAPFSCGIVIAADLIGIGNHHSNRTS
jgi:hypothetical protein